jgi:8-oxo-dGTP diphosphatase
VIISEDRRICLQLRDDSKNIFFPGRWGFFGGAIESGETPLDAVVREVGEEISVTFAPTRFLYLGNIELQLNDFNLMRYYFELKVSQLEVDSFKLNEGKAIGNFEANEVEALDLTPYDEYFFCMVKNEICLPLKT